MKKATKTITPQGETAAPFTLQKESVDMTESRTLPLFTYLKGRPKQYRFNGQNGKFNLNGTDEIGKTLAFIPLAWRVFEAELFGRDRRELWAEIFFVDGSNCLSAIMFNNSSANILYKLIETLFYEGKTLADVELTVTSEVRQNSKIEGGGKYFVAQFIHQPADREKVDLFRAFCQQNPVYRQDTLSESETLSLCSESYFQSSLLAA
jgi:hypothetical protein